MLEEDHVRTDIHALMERKELRITELQRENRKELRASKRLHNEVTVMELQHGVDTLIELEHILKLCGCPETVYQIGKE